MIFLLLIFLDSQAVSVHIFLRLKGFLLNLDNNENIIVGVNKFQESVKKDVENILHLSEQSANEQVTQLNAFKKNRDIKLVKKFKKKFKFIDESYNANPLSMTSALKNMNYYKRKNNAKKIVFLGDMLELGKKSKRFHRELSNVINKSDIDKVFVYGHHIKQTFKFLSTNKKGKIFTNLKEAYDHLGKILHNNDLLMVKGSNATGLNHLSKKIKRGLNSAI